MRVKPQNEDRESEEEEDISAGAKTACIVANQSTTNWYNYGDRQTGYTEAVPQSYKIN